MEALAVALGLGVVRVHVVRHRVVRPAVVEVDVTEERTTGALLSGLVVRADCDGVSIQKRELVRFHIRQQAWIEASVVVAQYTSSSMKRSEE